MVGTPTRSRRRAGLVHGWRARSTARADARRRLAVLRLQGRHRPAETYGAGRFLTAAPPRDGTVVLDFNRAYNPPCAFSPYATCPLPLPRNVLPVRIEAGEKKWRPLRRGRPARPSAAAGPGQARGAGSAPAPGPGRGRAEPAAHRGARQLGRARRA